MIQNKEEPDVELYLKGESDLSADYRSGSKEQPPAAIDDSLRAAARRELGTGPAYAVSPFASKWQVPLSLAAVLVLSVSVFLTMQQDYQENNFTTPAEEQFVDTESLKEIEVDEGNSVLASPSAASSVMKERKEETRTLRKKSNIVDKNSASMPDVIAEDFAPHPDDIPQTKASKAEKALPERYSSGAADHVSSEARANTRKDMESDAVPSARVAAEGKVLEPQQWLEKINQLWKEGNKQEAEKSLRAFSRVYPDFELDGHLDEILIKVLKTGVNQ